MKLFAPPPAFSALNGAFWLSAALLAAAPPPAADAQGWAGYGRDAQHSALGSVASQKPERIRWSTPVDLAPQYTSSGELLTHYGSPLITKANTVMVPVKTQAGGGFRVEARKGADGTLLYSVDSDYTLPHHNWIPPFTPTLAASDKALVMAGAGGTLIVRTYPDQTANHIIRVAFYGTSHYLADPSTCASAIQICTPISSDQVGNIYFGYVSTGAPIPGYPNGIPSGLARVSSTGVGRFISAAAMSGDNNIKKVTYNCAPALSLDGSVLYVSVNNVDPSHAGNFGNGYLCKLTSATLTPVAKVALHDPHNNNLAAISDDGTASPTIGPDGDVYFGVLESGFPSNNARGWLLHFDGALANIKIPGAFGWDDTASVVPASLVSSYTGTSKYLVLTKYNNYGGIGTGNGLNKVAVLDPNTSMVDPVSGATVMKEVLTVLGPTPDPNHANGVREWCINSAAIDPVNKCAVVNSEDGHVYRWDFTTNALSTGLSLAPPTGEAYTPTVIGPDGAVYAINDAKLFCCVANPPAAVRQPNAR